MAAICHAKLRRTESRGRGKNTLPTYTNHQGGGINGIVGHGL